jgi:hypothetical protein
MDNAALYERYVAATIIQTSLSEEELSRGTRRARMGGGNMLDGEECKALLGNTKSRVMVQATAYNETCQSLRYPS